MTSTVIVTGSSGYIGGQTALQLKDQGYRVLGVDIRPTPDKLKGVFDMVAQTDFASPAGIDFITTHTADAVIHCAGTSLVGPSVLDPELYYENNFVRTKRLCDAIVHRKLTDMRIIFSSSASVYGEPIMTPCNEVDPPLPVSPYGESKLMIEMMMQSYFRAYGLQPVMFRYFNACGADPQARHGQAPGATHIIARVLESLRDDREFTLYGDQYSTADGTCVRDYIHVADIANAHIRALFDDMPTGVYNLGSSAGTSNYEIIRTAEEITGRKLKLTIDPPRAGDPAVLTASSDRFDSVAEQWRQHDLRSMIKHAWAWYTQ